MSDKKIIAIIGLPGSGKSETIDYLMEKLKCPKIYFGDVTFAEMRRRGLRINQKNEKIVREDLRKKFGKNHYAEQVAKKIKKMRDDKIILLESLYSWEEYLYFKKMFKNNFVTIAVYASPPIRYGRLSKRPHRPLSLKAAQKRDYAQITSLTQAGPIAMANYTVINNAELKTLHNQIDKLIENKL